MKKNSLTLRSILVVACMASSVFALKSLDDIQVGGTYRMILTTGDDLEGVVYSKNDSSLVLECKNTPYTFVKGLIIESRLIAPPAQKADSTTNSSSGAAPTETYSYQDLQKNPPLGRDLQVQMKNGSLFRGSLVSIDDEFIKLNVESSVIPIAQAVIDRITSIPVDAKTAPAAVEKAIEPQGPCDTIIVKNTEIDPSEGTGLDKILAGKILEEGNSSLTFMTQSGVRGVYPFDKIVRVFRHSQGNPETDLIRRYALPLICPAGMMLVEVPPGKAARPFFKMCIDKYEFPGKQGIVPQVNVSFKDAQKLCESQGKRLCTSQEWQWACSGLEGFPYAYGWVFDKTACNIDSRILEASGNRNRCTSKFGVSDMTGNVFEWVTLDNKDPAAMGGPLSKCQAVADGAGGDPKPRTGFRCCKSN